MNTEDYLVDIPMCVYNHERYIERAIEGVVSQKTNFRYRLIIGEDCSTDSTREIVSKYLNRYSDKVKVFFHERNLGVSANSIFLLKNCNAKYIALCDGDDYWTDQYKLQKQVDFLEANPHMAGCFHDVKVVDEKGNTIKENYYPAPLKLYGQAHAVKHGGAYATCSALFRSIVLKNAPQWFLQAPCDYTVDLLITEYGDIAHLNENMGAYRVHNKGIWQGVESSHVHAEEHIRRYFICLTNPKFKRNYGDYFFNRIAELSGLIALHYSKQRQFLKKIKYSWYFIYYTRPFNLKALNYLLGTLLFGSLYKRLSIKFANK